MGQLHPSYEGDIAKLVRESPEGSQCKKMEVN